MIQTTCAKNQNRIRPSLQRLPGFLTVWDCRPTGETLLNLGINCLGHKLSLYQPFGCVGLMVILLSWMPLFRYLHVLNIPQEKITSDYWCLDSRGKYGFAIKITDKILSLTYCIAWKYVWIIGIF